MLKIWCWTLKIPQKYKVHHTNKYIHSIESYLNIIATWHILLFLNYLSCDTSWAAFAPSLISYITSIPCNIYLFQIKIIHILPEFFQDSISLLCSSLSWFVMMTFNAAHLKSTSEVAMLTTTDVIAMVAFLRICSEYKTFSYKCKLHRSY